MDPWASPWAEEDAAATSTSVQDAPRAPSPPIASPPPRAATPEIDPWAVPATPRATVAEGSAAKSQGSPTESRNAQPWSGGWRAEREEPAAAAATSTSHDVHAPQETEEGHIGPVDDTADPWADPVRRTATEASHTSASQGWRSEPVEEGWQPTEHAAVTWGSTGGIGLVAQSAGIDSLNERRADWSTSAVAAPSYAGEPMTDIDAAFAARIRGSQRSASSSAAEAPEQSNGAAQPASSVNVGDITPKDVTKASPFSLGTARETLASLSAKAPRLSSTPASTSSIGPAAPSTSTVTTPVTKPSTEQLAVAQQTRGEGWEMKKKPAPSALAGFVGGWISQRGARGREEDSDNVVRGNEEDSEDEEEQAGVNKARGSHSGEMKGSVVAQPNLPDLLGEEVEAEGSKDTPSASTSAQPSAVGRLWGRWRKPAAAEAQPAPAKPTGDIDADGLDWLASAPPSSANHQQHQQPPRTGKQDHSSIDDLFDFDSLSVASTSRAKPSLQQVLPPRPATSTPPYRDEPCATTAASTATDDWSWLDAAASNSVARQPTSSFSSPPILRPASNGPSSVRPAVQLLSHSNTTLNRSASAGKRPVLLPPPPPPSGRYSPSVAQQIAARPSSSSSSSSLAMASASSVPTFDFLSTPLPPNRPPPTQSGAGAVPLRPPASSSAAQPSQSRGPMTKDDLLFFESMG
ncbi:hypothetical protein BCV69DRAFT_68090 [Microstroma glucosiphilum]|uniref:Uncharacterized protein n=1 Tax=Pseudomicrostroma glucosiphilum TaxID=1684307 RepID=A0A316U062_9BASI|nr:hypothetical protein BCV69DRAFT_68090 [Pseudomicrostroma glucosiphilum]PWN18610.1 hypothetical protein BCV69DRAFT_68090 [Pseudomicrostroma glucosiphilum]